MERDEPSVETATAESGPETETGGAEIRSFEQVFACEIDAIAAA